jgi:hypothetical protein
MRFQERQKKFERRSKLYKLQQKGLQSHERIPATRRTFYSFIYMFICGLFKEDVSSTDYGPTTSNGGTTSE